MTLFEYITVAVSIVLSFAMIRLLDGLRPALSREGRYWVHVAWVGIKLLNLLLFWWGFWNLRDVAWSLGWFVWILLLPGMLYLQATALVTRNPHQVNDWRRHFYGIRRWFFTVNGLNIVHTFITGTFLLGIPLAHPARVVQVTILACSVLGVISEDPRLHSVIAVVILLCLLLGFGSLLFQPGSMGAA